ncbi:glycosyltransferase family 34 protein [Stemphylium lycopersici]|uniref:Glycosyltransferase family 34 protein n=1 Tax=Stemphylium lycopersici TaxID=183478 RepID=A0A364MXX7_STELY|nr:glycosyltransferase family 34 protein [Stemphylium lycopersici]
MYASPRLLTSKFFISLCLLLIGFPSLLWDHGKSHIFSIPYPRLQSKPVPQFVAHGDSKCLPDVSPQFIETATAKRATCRKYSPFATGRARIATVTAQFGNPEEHYQVALQTHLLHALVHGTEVRVMCDPIVDDLWNKPAFILNLLMREMLKPERERLEWIQWVDRDTLILDQCRPISSFLPSERERFGSWWRRDDNDEPPQSNKTYLLITEDWNGLNNGVFLLRVNSWAIELFTAILAFRHYEPDVDLPFTEQSAMDHVLRTDHFKDQARYVPQHWFNGYPDGNAQTFEQREDVKGLHERHVRRGDYLVHFAGLGKRDKAIKEWTTMLNESGDVWKERKVQRDTSQEIETFWKELGYDR